MISKAERRGKARAAAIWAALLALALLAASCGGGSAPGGTTPGADIDGGNSVIGIDIIYSPTAITIVEGEQITAAGGTINAQRLNLDIPQDSIRTGDTVNFKVLADNSIGAGAPLSNGNIADRVASFGDTYVVLAQLTPSSGQYQFVTGIDISLSYNPNEIPFGFTENDLTVFQFKNNQWENIGGGGLLDPVNHEISLNLQELAPIRLAVLKSGDITLLSLNVSPASLLLVEGETQNLTARGSYSNFSTVDITNFVNWISLNPAVASVSSDGKVTAMAAGSATIRAEYGQTAATASVIVTDIDPPSKVQGVTAVNTKLGNSVLVRWEQVADADVVSYKIYYNTQSFTDTAQATLGGTVGPQDSSLTVTGLTDGTYYYFGVVAVDEVGNQSPLSALQREMPQDVTPPNPTNNDLHATPLAQNPGEVLLDWNSYDESNAPDLTIYEIYVYTQNFDYIVKPGAILVAEVQPGAKTYTVQGLTSGTTYYFAVVPVDDSANRSQPLTTTSAVPY